MGQTLERSLENKVLQLLTLKKKLVRCICPRCHQRHLVYMLWTGRGMPRKYCPMCRSTVSGYDWRLLDGTGPLQFSHSRRKARCGEDD
jgi:hypothetical protein